MRANHLVRVVRGRLGAASAMATLLLSWSQVGAQHQSGYEPTTYSGSPAGTDLNGQDGFYNPIPATSVTAKVYTYAGNALGIPPNRMGGDQFVGATGPAANIFVRSQKDVSWCDGTGIFNVQFDVAVTFTGVAPSAQNIGSLSTQPLDTVTPLNAGFIALARWTDPVVPVMWNADYAHWNAANALVIEPVPDTAFQSLLVNHWYRWKTVIDLDTNLIIEVSITDLDTGVTNTANPLGWFLSGGAAGGLAPPSGFRFFGGSATVAGNTVCFDNLSIGQPDKADLNGDRVVNVQDLVIVVLDWGCTDPPGPCPGDANGDGVVNVQDLVQVILAWGVSCE